MTKPCRMWAPITCVLAVIFLSAFTTGCSGKSTRPGDGESPTVMGPPPAPESTETVGPPLPPSTEAEQTTAPGPNEEQVGPLPGADYTPPKDGYVLVLGPGLARGLAYLGVLREMEERNLSVNAVVGVEIGAVIGGIWASSNLNNLEWEMHKFNKNTLLDFPLLRLGAKIAEGKRLYSFLDESIKVNMLQKMKVPVVIASAITNNEGSAEGLIAESNGSAKDIIRGAMGLPGILKSYSWEGKERMTAAIEKPFPVEEAKKLGLGKVVCVDVVGRGDNFVAKEPVEEHLGPLMRSVAALARQELKECDHVLTIPVDNVGYFNFDAKADLIYKGKQAVRRWQGGN